VRVRTDGRVRVPFDLLVGEAGPVYRDAGAGAALRKPVPLAGRIGHLDRPPDARCDGVSPDARTRAACGTSVV
jgi:hypothetical protein